MEMGRPLLPDSLAIALAYRAHISLVLRQTTGAEETSEIRTKGMSALHCFAASRVGALHLCVVAAAHDEGDGAAEGRAHPRHLAANRRRGLAGAARFGRLRGASHRGAASRSRDSPREGEPRRGRTPASGSGTSPSRRGASVKAPLEVDPLEDAIGPCGRSPENFCQTAVGHETLLWQRARGAQVYW